LPSHADSLPKVNDGEITRSSLFYHFVLCLPRLPLTFSTHRFSARPPTHVNRLLFGGLQREA